MSLTLAEKSTGPHGHEKILTAGPEPEQAAAVILLIHGRGADAQGMIDFYEELAVPTCSAIAPQAANHTWYPQSFLAPLSANQPYLDSALEKLEAIVAELLGRGIKSEQLIILGFSQGACLSCEFAARHPRTYGAILALTGGLIGPTGTPRNYPGSLTGTTVFLGSGDPDPHVPFARVEETASVLKKMGAAVELRRYPGRPHTISGDEQEACRNIIQTIANRNTRVV